MKTKFSSKLFEKKIDIKDANLIFGAETGGCVDTVFTGDDGCDEVSTFYNDEGKKTRKITSYVNCG